MWRLALLGGIVTASAVVLLTPASLEFDVVGRSAVGPGLDGVRQLRRLRGTSERDPVEPFWLRGLTAAVIALPLVWLPTVPAPSALHGSIFVEEREVGQVPDVGSSEADPAERRVFIARIRGG